MVRCVELTTLLVNRCGYCSFPILWKQLDFRDALKIDVGKAHRLGPTKGCTSAGRGVFVPTKHLNYFSQFQCTSVYVYNHVTLYVYNHGYDCNIYVMQRPCLKEGADLAIKDSQPFVFFACPISCTNQNQGSLIRGRTSMERQSQFCACCGWCNDSSTNL